MNARLKVLHQKSNVKHVKLQPITVVGRSSECDLKIASNLVSRVHCRITVREDAVYIEDLGSANGTFVDGEQLKPNQPRAVISGAKVSVGPVEFLVEYVAPTTNTVVIRRSENATKGGSPGLKDPASLGKSEAYLTSANSVSDDSTANSNNSTLRNDLGPFKPIDTVKPESREPWVQTETWSQASDSTGQFLPKQNPASSAISKAKNPAPTPVAAPQIPPTAMPFMASVITTEIAPTAHPVALRAEVISTLHSSDPIKSGSENPFQFGKLLSPKAEESKVPSNTDVQKVKIAPEQMAVVEVAPVVEFAEFVESPPATDLESSDFNFSDPNEDQRPKKPIAKVGKRNVLQSLLSMFACQPKPKKSSSTTADSPVPVSTVVEDSTETINETASETSSEVLGFGSSPSKPEATDEPANTSPDDDFQNFLRQF